MAAEDEVTPPMLEPAPSWESASQVLTAEYTVLLTALGTAFRASTGASARECHGDHLGSSSCI